MLGWGPRLRYEKTQIPPHGQSSNLQVEYILYKQKLKYTQDWTCDSYLTLILYLKNTVDVVWSQMVPFEPKLDLIVLILLYIHLPKYSFASSQTILKK